MPLRTIELDSSLLQQLFTPGFRRLVQLFNEKNYELRVVGGAVRDLLLGLTPTDIDFATTATTEQMREMFEFTQIPMFNKSGTTKHGTITAYVLKKEIFEVTTLRGEGAGKERPGTALDQISPWEVDALQRDFTINSMFLDLDGTIYDYTGGLEDLAARRVVFIGDPLEGTRENKARVLRYFRFCGRIGTLEPYKDSACIEAIKQCRDVLDSISDDRKWMELRKILVGRLAYPVLRVMLDECGLHEQLGLPSAPNFTEFQRVAEVNLRVEDNDGQLALEPCTALVALLRSEEELKRFRRRMKLSNAERRLAKYLMENRVEAMEMAAAEAKGDESFTAEKLFYSLKCYVLRRGCEGNSEEVKETAIRHCEELLKYVNASKATRRRFHHWVEQRDSMETFPITGLDLKEAGVDPLTRSYRQLLDNLFQLWEQSEFVATKEDLLQHLTGPMPDEKIDDKKRAA